MSNAIFSPDILEYTNKIIQSLDDAAYDYDIDYFEEYSDPVLGRKIFHRLLCETATRNLLEREDGDIMLDSEQFMRCMRESVIRTSLETLRQKGLVDWIENENGDDVVFVTEKGKDMGKSLFGNLDEYETSK